MHFRFNRYLGAFLGILLFAHADVALAQTYGGGSVLSGIQQALGLLGFGGGSIGSFINNLIGSLRSIVNIVGVLAIVIAGFYLILGFGDEGAKDRAKKIVLYTLVGIVVVNIAHIIVGIFYDLQSGRIGGGVAMFVLNLISSLKSFVNIFGVLAIVVAGFYLILGFGDEGAKDKAKKIVIYTLIGVVLVNLAEWLVGIFVAFQDGTISGNVAGFVANIISSLRSLVYVLGVLAIVVAGFYLLLGFGDEGSKDTAKKIVIYAIVGIILITLAELIVSIAMGFSAGGSFGGNILGFLNGLINSLRSLVYILGVLAIIVAGFYLLLGFGSEGAKDTAKRIVIYAIIGIILITLADLIVSFAMGFSAGGGFGGNIAGFISGLISSLRSIVYVVAVFAIVIAGFYLLLGFGSESAKDTAKRIVIYTIVGVLLITLADIIVGLAFGVQAGGSFDGSFICSIYSILLQAITYVALIGTIAIIVAGFYLLLGFGSESAKDTAQRIIIYTIAGILLITFSAAIVGLVFVLAGGSPQLNLCGSISSVTGVGGDFRQVAVDLLDFALSFLALLAVVALVVAGFMLILGLGSESSRDRALRIVIYTIIGLLVIFFARVIVAFFLNLPSNL